MAAVFVAGPISGFLVQPVIGLLADQSTHRWGRRRPYLLVACFITAVFLLLLGFARVVAEGVGAPSATLPLTIVAIWGLDLAVNAVMALDRSLILDMLPSDQQADGNAWAARLTNVGSILGFYVGDVTLPDLFPFSWMSGIIKDGSKVPSEPQVRCLTLATAFLLLVAHALTAWAAIEVPLQPSSNSRPKAKLQLFSVVRSSLSDFAKTARSLPQPIRSAFRIQIFSWICWFPMLFYSTEWVSSTAVNAYIKTHGVGTDEEMKALRANGTRAGSHALFLQAMLSFGCSIVLPFLLPASQLEASSTGRSKGAWLAPSWLPALLQRPLEFILNRSSSSTSGGIPLTTFWFTAHILLALVTFSTWPVSAASSLGGATFLIGIAGYAWAICLWAPFALLGILVQEGGGAGQGRPVALRGSNSTAYEALSLGGEGEDQGEDSNDFDKRNSRSAGAKQSHNIEDEEAAEDQLYFDPTDSADQRSASTSSARRRSSLSILPMHGSVEVPLPTASPTKDPAIAEKAGTILGLHNIAIVTPQFIVSITAACVFAFFEPDTALHPEMATQETTGSEQPTQTDAIGVILRMGGFSSLVAAWLTWKFAKTWSA